MCFLLDHSALTVACEITYFHSVQKPFNIKLNIHYIKNCKPHQEKEKKRSQFWCQLQGILNSLSLCSSRTSSDQWYERKILTRKYYTTKVKSLLKSFITTKNLKVVAHVTVLETAHDVNTTTAILELALQMANSPLSKSQPFDVMNQSAHAHAQLSIIEEPCYFE